MENKYSADFDFQSKLQAAVSGELNDTEKEGLKSLIDTDSDAKEEYIFSEKLSKTLKNQDVLAISVLIGSIIETEGLPDTDDLDMSSDPQPPPQYATPTKAVSGIKLWLVGITTASLVTISLYGVYAYKNSQNRHLTIALSNKYLQNLENDLYTQTIKQGMSHLEAGMEAYNNKDYANAVILLGKHYKQTNDEMVGLYLSISMLLNGDNNSVEAEDLLSKIKPKLPAPIMHIADWYLILAKLKNNKKNEAVDMLNHISKESPYYMKSSELSTDLKLNN